MFSHWFFCGVLLFCSDHNTRYNDAIVKHSLSCTYCRRGTHPLHDFYSSDTRNDLKELMTGRAMNGLQSEKYFAQDLSHFHKLLGTGTKSKIVPATKLLARMLHHPGFTLFNIEAWLYTSIFKAHTAMYSVLPSPGPFTQESPRLPSRVLELSGSFPGKIRLIESTPGQVGCYFALSHRWGTSKKLLLTRRGLAKLKNGIYSQSLPKTFRDAVRVTSQFGCPFLWIDSLCILQDDIDDWLKESTRMANVYHQATCVIAAHSAQDDNEGFLSASWPFQIQTHTSQDNTGFHEYVNESGLSQRGWVFQERILSKRLLHFTSRRLFLEDASGVGVVTEVGLVHLPGDLSKGNKLNVEDAFHNSAQWYTLIERYSRCELTRDIDRLPAITGLARIFGEMSGSGNFMFGLWSESIHRGLLWIQAAGNPIRLTEAYHPGWHCPTWSWAAWKGRVSFPPCVEALESLVTLTEEQDSQLDFMMLENLGPQNPTLTISGKLLALFDVRVVYEKIPEVSGKFTERRCRFIPTNPRMQTFAFSDGSRPSDERRCRFISTNPRMHTFAFFDGLRPGDERIFDRLWLLLIAKHCDKQWVVREKGDEETLVMAETNRHYYIVLEEAGEHGYFRRIGTGARIGFTFWEDAQQTTVCII